MRYFLKQQITLGSLLAACLLLGLLIACESGQEQATDSSFQVPEGLDHRTELRFKQYAVQGRILYKQHCANCHQPGGGGLAALIPPLAKSDYLQQNLEDVACIIRYGMQGSITVNGKEYNQPMPPNPQLRDIEIAEIITYITNAWGNQGRLVSVKEVQEWLKTCEQAE